MSLIGRISSAARAAVDALRERPLARTTIQPVEDPVVARPIQYASSEHFRRLTPAALGRALREAEAGNLAAQCEVFDEIETDAYIMATLRKRKRAVAGRRLQISPSVQDDQRAADAAELCEELVEGCENWNEALVDVLDAVGKGYSATEIVWRFDGRRFMAPKLRWWPQHELVLDARDSEKLRVLTDEEPERGVALEPAKWIVLRHKARSSALATAGMARTLAWQYVFKHGTVKDWLMFSERAGHPFRLGKYNPSHDNIERNAVLSAVRSLGRDGAAVIPQGASIEFLVAAKEGDQPFSPLVAACNREISICVLGVTLTTEQGDKGARSLGEVHQSDQDELCDADAEALAQALRRQFFAHAVRFNLGPDHPVPLVAFISKRQENKKQLAERDKVVIKDIGLPVAEDDLYDRYEMPRPAPGARLVGGGISGEEKPEPPPVPAPPKQSDENVDDQVDDNPDNQVEEQ